MSKIFCQNWQNEVRHARFFSKSILCSLRAFNFNLHSERGKSSGQPARNKVTSLFWRRIAVVTSVSWQQQMGSQMGLAKPIVNQFNKYKATILSKEISDGQRDLISAVRTGLHRPPVTLSRRVQENSFLKVLGKYMYLAWTKDTLPKR